MRIIMTSVSLLIIVFTTVTDAFINWESMLPEPMQPMFEPARPPTKPPPTAFIPVKDSRYCDESELTKIFSKRERRAASLWPFNCLYAGIVFYQGKYQFMRDIYKCCEKCDFPTYTACIKNHGSSKWRCPSDGVVAYTVFSTASRSMDQELSQL
ncbi:uncharacterized protein LOC114518329 [Dendronephthya gigantea]|uniref:uncharacterized protein LOC114518329 n=1 Tax=Dendronephthya gigantea TaxID=151771 RepID=UPI00106D8B21|nr:uncharacterized protein LOC114518329 [Dendronephthya gigantea]